MRLVGQPECQVVAQIVEAKFVVGAVNHITGVGRGLVDGVHSALDDPDRQTQEFINRPHPVRIALREVFVNGDDLHAVAAERVQVSGQGCDQGLAFPGAHFRNFAFVQNQAADQLHIEMAQAQGPDRRFTHNGKGFREHVFQCFSAGYRGLQLVGPGPQFAVTQGLKIRFILPGFGYVFCISPEQALVAAAKQSGKEILHQCSSWRARIELEAKNPVSRPVRGQATHRRGGTKGSILRISRDFR